MNLRKLELKDAPLMLEWMHDPDVVQNMQADFAHKTLSDCENFIRVSHTDDKNLHLAVVDDNNTYMGTVSLKNIENDAAEFAITVRKNAMGKGFSKYAMSEIIRIGLEELNLKSIYWCVSPENKRAVKFYDGSNTDSILILSPPSPLGEEAAAPPERKGTGAKSQSAVEIYREIIKDNIEYEHLCQYAKGIDRDMLDEIVDLLVETVCSARKTIRIAGDDYPAELVKSKLMKLNSSHIEFVFDCISKNTTEIRNIKKYLLAVLFNAPSTINGYYTALVAHDMNTGKI